MTTALLTSWAQTEIWKALSDRNSLEDELVKATLNLEMPKIEAVLASGGTAPLDFTLHDAGHSFRVAERMAQIIPASAFAGLSTYELALLLLAAYLHDIGMTPERGKVAGVYNYLLTGESKGLSADEMNALQAWLDEHGEGVAPFVSAATPTPESLRKTCHLTTHFCRDRHNHWSADWMRRNLTNATFGSYNGWLEDLVALCRSHHEGYIELKSDRFDPRGVGRDSAIVHLRYLAASLRVADVLDVDPERTPEAILRHREVSPSSLIYWWKDQQMSVAQEGSRIVITARPQGARMQKAIETTIEQINHELALCRKLGDDTHFEVCPGRAALLPHRWELTTSAYVDIRARDDAYEYIDGSFRPDTQKLLQLLSGVELYGHEMVAVRELLQNAFDAVREQIAYGRLEDPDPANPTTERKFSQVNRVDLRLEFSPDGAWLVCKDTGVGMTKAIIRDHLLVSGVGRRHDTLDLERRCKARGFSLGRTGQFGIGVLSYFMLADRVVIKTRRAAEPGDSESNGWRFETEGVGSFGELRKDTTTAHGTETWLRLRQTSDMQSWYSQLVGYLQWALVRIPCRFSLKSTIDGCAELVMEPGFTRREAYLSEDVASNIRPRSWRDETPADLLSVRKRKQLEEQSQSWQTISDEISKSLRWKISEGSLPDELGCFRLYLPYFDVTGGLSLAFLRPLEQGKEIELRHVGEGYCYVPTPRCVFGWKGMQVQIPHEQLYSMRRNDTLSVIIDWASEAAGPVTVSRASISLSEKAQRALDWLDEKRSEIYEDFLTRHASSIWSALNQTTANSSKPRPSPLHWAVTVEADGSSKVMWQAIVPPLLCASSFAYESVQRSVVLWNSEPVHVTRCLGRPDAGAPYEGPSWIGPADSPDRIMARLSGPFFWGVLPLWVRRGGRVSSCPAGLSSSFPPEWSAVCGVRVGRYGSKIDRATVWNSQNDLVKSVTLDAWQLCFSKLGPSLDPLPFRDLLLADRARASTWVLLCLQADARELWDGLPDRDESFLHQLWIVLFGPDSPTRHVLYWLETTADDHLRILTPKSWTAVRPSLQDYNKRLHEYMPMPSEDWLIRLDNLQSGSPFPPAPKGAGS